MGFKDDKQAILEMLRQGLHLHETRAFQAEKNWLSTGDITQEKAWEIVSKVSGRLAESSPQSRRIQHQNLDLQARVGRSALVHQMLFG